VRRVAIVTSASGCGGTTVGRRLARRLGVPFHELDALFWQPDWTEPDAEDFRARAAEIVASDSWVIDGSYQSWLGQLVLAEADIVVWLDLPLRVWLPRLLRRTVSRAIRGEELWAGNRESLRNSFASRDSLILFALRHHRRRRAAYPARGSPPTPSSAFGRRRPSSVSSAKPAGARPQLRDPRRSPEPEPDRRQEDVEDEIAEHEQKPPEGEATRRHPALLPQVAAPAGGRAERVAQGGLSRSAVRAGRGRLVADARAAARLRRSTRRMIRIAVSSTESSVTSMTGQRSRRWSFEASSSSA
jgi:adenylate kinase family enzyme